MSGMSGIHSVSSYSSYGALASGRRISTAADGAAELAVIQEENAQITGYQVGANNMQSAKEMLNISDSALSGINDSLQRIRELALQASNTATVSDANRKGMQAEVDQLKQGIRDIAEQTQYNTKTLLNGSNTSFQLATDGRSGSAAVNTVNATLEALGIEDFDLTKDFDLQTLDDAISKVSEARSSIGAQSNGLDYAINFNLNASYQLTGAKSRLEDLDYPQAVSEQKKEQLLMTYSLMMQQKRQEEEENKMHKLFA